VKSPAFNGAVLPGSIGRLTPDGTGADATHTLSSCQRPLERIWAGGTVWKIVVDAASIRRGPASRAFRGLVRLEHEDHLGGPAHGRGGGKRRYDCCRFKD